MMSISEDDDIQVMLMTRPKIMYYLPNLAFGESYADTRIKVIGTFGSAVGMSSDGLNIQTRKKNRRTPPIVTGRDRVAAKKRKNSDKGKARRLRSEVAEAAVATAAAGRAWGAASL